MFQKLSLYLNQAERSKLSLRFLNLVLYFGVPFNRPHGLKVIQVNKNEIKSFLPYKSKNLNHISGIHACALATVSEFCSGLLLLKHFSASDYRLIMKNIQCDYTFQAKTDIIASCQVPDSQIEEISNSLSSSNTTEVNLLAYCRDNQENLCCTANITWQLKPWKKVETK